MKIKMFVCVVIFVIFLCVFGCTPKNPAASCKDPPWSVLPDINNFSPTEYEPTEYVFSPIKSATYIHDGITEDLDPNDPRLYRLLNAISYSYDQSYTSWLQGHVTEEPYLTYINSGVPMLEIQFRTEEAPPYDTEFAETPRIIICANSYLMLVDTSKSSWMSEGSIYANQHWPFVQLLLDHYDSASEQDHQEIIGDTEWGNPKWLDLLEYAGFH